MENTDRINDAPSVKGVEEQRPRLRDAWRHPPRFARQLANSPLGLRLIGIASFLETIIVPIPIEIVLIPYMLARRDLIWRIASVTTAACLFAAVVGYGLGYFFYDSVGRGLIDLMNWQQDYAVFQSWFDAQGFWAILAIGVAPIPFQIAMLVAGVAGYPLVLFVLAAGIARSIRYFGLALLVRMFGERALDLWQRHKLTASIVVLALIAAAVALKFVVAG
jgi:membrane protein YqaA with SNARE-associated domain